MNSGWAKVKDFSGESPSCSCHRFTGMMLPCSHIFSLRLENDILPFVQSMIPTRWSTGFILDTANIDIQSLTDNDDYISSSQGSTAALPEMEAS